MSGQLQRGAAGLIELMAYDLDEAERHLSEARANIRRNPDICADAIGDALRELSRLRRRVSDDLAAMLSRRAARDDLVAATEALREALRHLERDNVTEFRTGTK